MCFVTPLEEIWHGRPDLSVRILRTEIATVGAVGNKHYKLTGNLEELKSQGCKWLLSFGGAWSNHLHALSIEARRNGLGLVGIVRGDEGVSNRMLQSAQRNGMRVVMVSRSEYRQRHSADHCQQLCFEYGCDGWLPEGGSTAIAVRGCEHIMRLLDKNPVQISPELTAQPDVIALAVGTGATMAGVVRSGRPQQTVVGLPVVADDSVPGKISDWVGSAGNPQSKWYLTDPLKPRYGRVDAVLVEFILRFYDETGIALDPVYTGKALLHILSPEFTSQLASNTQLLFIHTGGLMGSFGFVDEFKKNAEPRLVDRYFSRIETLLAD